jgi:hypothetical protein
MVVVGNVPMRIMIKRLDWFSKILYALNSVMPITNRYKESAHILVRDSGIKNAV